MDEIVNGKLRATLDLVRLPNIITAIADVIAGFLFVGGQLDQWATVLIFIGASSCLYAGGVALNDVCDARRDAINRSNRPIPSGIIQRKHAAILAVVLLLVGVTLSTFVSRQSAWIATLIVISILLYNTVFKQTFLAPGFMGMCRALNLLLGMSVVPLAFTSTTMIPVGLMWLYITSVTAFARRETQTNQRWRLILSTTGVCVSVAGLMSLYWVVDKPHIGFVAAMVITILWISSRAVRACVQPNPQHIQCAVKTMILGLIFFDATIVWSTRGYEAAMLVAALLVPSMILSRMFRVT